MTNVKSTKRALLLSVVALLLCFTMLMGTTYAWFTDSVTSAGNKIVAGTLDIQLFMYNGTDYVEITDESAPIFGKGALAQADSSATLWEPGKTQMAYFKLVNNGTLDLKYQVAIEVKNVEKDLIDVVTYAVSPDAKPTDNPAIDGWGGSGVSVIEGLNLATAEMVELGHGVEHYFALSIHMDEEAGNEYQEGSIDFDIRVLATQLDSESDSFNKDYDADSKWPLGKNQEVNAEFNGYKAEVNIPAEVSQYDYELAITDVKYDNDNGNATLAFDMNLVDKTEGEIPVTMSKYPVVVKLPHPFVSLDNVQVLHNGELVEDVTYDEETLTISFTTTHFSPFEIKYVDYVNPDFELEYTKNGDSYTITKGMFIGLNPAEIDKSLAEADSEYVVVDYVKNGVKNYVISKRATTVILGDADDDGTDYTFENANVPAPVMINNNQLYTYLDKSGTVYDTVYLLPGTYKEQTTLTVDSDKDIIGLGDTENIKVIKIGAHSNTTKKPSNRHLFNCTNSDPNTYIKVTIRNLTLDATEKNSYIKIFLGKEQQSFDDNAAVQSIRRSMVKCYDLIVVKENNSAYKAFYVNSNNTVDDGVAYPAYMYAQNISINSKNIASVVEATGSGKSYFYYDDVQYDNGAKTYDRATSYIKNQTMSPDDWTWD